MQANEPAAATVDHYERLKEYAVWGGADSTYQWALNEIERLRWVERRVEDVKEALEGKSVVDAALVRRLL